MEEHQSAAHATPEAEQQQRPPPEQKQPQVELAVAVASAAAENGDGPAEGGDGSPAAAVDTALLGGARRTGLHLFHAAAAATDPEKQQSAEEATKNNGDSTAEPGDASPAELAGAEGCAPAVVGRKSGKNRRFVPSVTSALIVGAFLGLFQTALLVAAGKPLLRLMGVKSAMIASAFARKDHYKVAATTARVLQLGVVLGAALTVVLGLGMQFGAGVFTKDAAVIKTVQKGVPVRISR
ncbi:hypothetical protein C2845_PM13G17320 [Panicum miliaceum]|uniref:Uncharacterized protein n=1 Tax=Panicum miliaceum TaxID=4540 RepID=A0A3L6RN42_PANMI|nr:hypothetical protein C2845_PM13G17320 [Panicum miliaceum]